MKVNEIEFRRYTVFYRCIGVEKIVEALKNLESAKVDDRTIEEIAEKVLENIGRKEFDFDLNVTLRLNDLKFEFEKIKFYFRSVENPDYLAISTSPKRIRVVANLRDDYDFILNLSEKVSEHIKTSLNIKNAYEFIDIDRVRYFFNEKISCFLGFKFIDIVKDFIDIALKDFEDRIIIAKSCDALKYLKRFREIVFILNCPIMLDEILKRTELSKMSGRELRKLGYSKDDVIKPEEIVFYMLKVIE